MALPHPTSPDVPSTGSWSLDLALDRLAEVIASVGDGVLERFDLGANPTDGDNLLVALRLLARLRGLRQALAQAEAVVEAVCARSMEAQTLEAPGLYAQRRGGNTYKAWRNTEVAEALTARVRDVASVDRATGEVDDVRAEAAQTAIDYLLTAVGPSGWKATGMRKLGLDPDRYCTVERGRRTVQVLVGDEAEAAKEATE